eukprot:5135364-Alexandrium_andersonii.AAC.1
MRTELRMCCGRDSIGTQSVRNNDIMSIQPRFNHHSSGLKKPPRRTQCGLSRDRTHVQQL